MLALHCHRNFSLKIYLLTDVFQNVRSVAVRYSQLEHTAAAPLQYPLLNCTPNLVDIHKEKKSK
jgi:hypothetical protein